MALEVVGGGFFSAIFHQVFQKMDSQEVKNFIKGKKLTDGLLKQLRIKLKSVNAVFDDAEQKQISNPDVREWLHELKETILDAEDLLEEIKTEALKRKMEAEYGSGTSKVQELITASCHAFDESIDTKIEEILWRLGFIAEQKDSFDLKPGGRHRFSHTLPSTSLVQDSDVHGRHDDKETIVKLLLSAEANIKLGVISIVGLGGIGKTTLAQLLYNDDRVEKHFELRVWVCVSEEFDVVKITQTIYGSVTKKTCDITDLDRLQVQLKEALTGKKFMFVLDDVWNENYDIWDLLRHPFESGARGSKIIVTTRNARVASTMGALQSHNVMGISEEDGWLVFSKHAFSNATVSANPSIEKIGRNIVHKCKGLPLAVKSLGGLLRSQSNLEEWESVLNSEIWELSEKESNILPALWLSYQYLPPYLKRCFAYCSIFPKDYEIYKSELVLLWMAEDLLQPRWRKTMEEVGESYIDHLISRSFFQHSASNGDNYFIMHDLINDLAKFVSGEFSVRFEDNGSLDNISKARHFSSMTSSDIDYEKYGSLNEAKYLRTFLASNSFNLPKVRMDLLLKLQYLRVLKLSGLRMEEFPDSISNLKYLRLLDLSWSSIIKLPDTVCSLYNLQTLLLYGCVNLAELPTHFKRLIHLRHLDIQHTMIRKMPPGMGKLKDLQTLTGEFVLDKDTGDNIVELKGFEHLHKELCIRGLQNIVNAEDALEAKMRDKKHLSKLILRWESDSTEDSQKDRQVLDNLQPHSNLKKLVIRCYGGITFPGWFGNGSLSNLVSLALLNCGYCLSVPALGQLPSLKKLDIWGSKGLELVGCEFYGGGLKRAFRSLERLRFYNMREWKEWSYVGGNKDEEGGAFPNLRVLHVRECPNLAEILPLDYFPKLEELDLCGLNIESLTISQDSISKCPNGVGGFQLPNLTRLRIVGCPKLRLLPDLHTLLPSLQSLCVSGSPELESIWEGEPPSKLEDLQIGDCEKLVASRMQWGLQALTSLSGLTIDLRAGEEIVESFPDKGMLPTTLAYLSLGNIKKIDVRELRQLTSLTELFIAGCPELQCLPDEGLPTSLRRLQIWGCPRLLEERCEREKGEDWPKIAHIPTIEINDRLILCDILSPW